MEGHMVIDGKVAVVTGAAVGIGRAIGERLAAEGAAACLTDLDEAGGAETLRRIVAAGGRAIFQRADVLQDAEAAGRPKPCDRSRERSNRSPRAFAEVFRASGNDNPRRNRPVCGPGSSVASVADEMARSARRSRYDPAHTGLPPLAEEARYVSPVSHLAKDLKREGYPNELRAVWRANGAARRLVDLHERQARLANSYKWPACRPLGGRSVSYGSVGPGPSDRRGRTRHTRP
ncbi:SDR family NAD(P)-dependent oxidoreductase [Actinoallomurus sp. CA-150999]|uniref:SDR family NAD(P)-dependent oxidoreductase n=1 Tax=Actinoallomurus sp. CA-150999 TaxID=3239887 RepID=UPI003D8F6F45